jgi:hypothetical protein
MICKKCNRDLPDSEFQRSSKWKSGWDSSCKNCRAKRPPGWMPKTGNRKEHSVKRVYFSFNRDLNWEIVERIKKEYWSGEWHRKGRYS